MATSSVDFAAAIQGMLIALFDTDKKKMFVSECSTGGWISDSCSYSSEIESGSIPYFLICFQSWSLECSFDSQTLGEMLCRAEHAIFFVHNHNLTSTIFDQQIDREPADWRKFDGPSWSNRKFKHRFRWSAKKYSTGSGDRIRSIRPAQLISDQTENIRSVQLIGQKVFDRSR